MRSKRSGAIFRETLSFSKGSLPEPVRRDGVRDGVSSDLLEGITVLGGRGDLNEVSDTRMTFRPNVRIDKGVHLTLVGLP